MEYNCFKHQNYNFYTVHTDKFKTCHLEIIYRKRLKKEDITINNVLSEYLTYTSFDYPKRKMAIEKFEDLYDVSLYSTVTRVGNTMFTNFIMDFLDPIYCDKLYLEEVIKLPFKFIFNPLFKDKDNSSNSFYIIKNSIQADILSLKDQSTKYAFKQALNTLSSDGPFYQMVGYLDDLDNITIKDLEKYYDNFFKENICDIYLIGNLDMDKVDKIIEKSYLSKDRGCEINNYFVDKEYSKELKNKEEHGNYEQSSLVVLLNATSLNDKEKTYVSHYFNTIFGNGALTNKLSKYLREEQGLCYTTYSMYNKLDNLILIYAGIDYENKDKCLSLIKKALKEMQNGKFLDSEIMDAKNTLVNQLKTAFDSTTSIIDNYVFHNLIKTPLLDDLVKGMGNVTKEDIVTVSNKLSINTIYLLGGLNENSSAK